MKKFIIIIAVVLVVGVIIVALANGANLATLANGAVDSASGSDANLNPLKNAITSIFSN